MSTDGMVTDRFATRVDSRSATRLGGRFSFYCGLLAFLPVGLLPGRLGVGILCRTAAIFQPVGVLRWAIRIAVSVLAIISAAETFNTSAIFRSTTVLGL